MIFWAVILGCIGLVLFLAWRKDHRRKVTINRRNPAVMNDIAAAEMYDVGKSTPPNLPSDLF